MSEVSVVMTANDATLWAAIQRQIGAAQKQKEGLDGVAKAGKAADQEMQRFADSVKRIVATPIERYQTQINKLDAALRADKITQQEHSRAVAAAKEQLVKATEATDEAALASARARDELKRFAEQTNKVNAKPLERYESEVRQLDAALRSNLITQETHARGVAKARMELDRSTGSQRSAISVGTSLIGRLSALAGGYLSLQGAISLVNKAYEDNIELQRNAAESQVKVGRAQQDAVKNLTGLSSEQKADILTRRAAELQASTGFPDRAALIGAIGAGFSASGSESATMSAAHAGALLLPATTDKLNPFVGGILDAARGTGVEDARRNVAFVLSAGSINRMDDPNKLATKLGPLASSGTAMLPRQQQQDAAREIGAVFGVLAREAGDKEGDKTATAQATLMGKMDKFFTERPELDPGTLFGRLGLFQSDKKLRAELWGENGFGEEQIKPALQRLLTSGTGAAAALAPAKEQINFDPESFYTAVRELRTLTPELRVTMADAKHRAAIEIQQLDSGIGFAGQIRSMRDDTLKATRRPGFGGVADLAVEMGDKAISTVLTESPQQLTSAAMNQLFSRQRQLLTSAMPEASSKALSFAQSLEAGEQVTDSELEFNRVSRDQVEQARPLARVLDKRFLSDQEIQGLPIDDKTRADLRLIRNAMDSIMELTVPVETLDRVLRSAETIAAPTPDAPPRSLGPDRTALSDRRQALLAEAFGLDKPDSEKVIEFAQRFQTDAELQALQKRGKPFDKKLQELGINKLEFGRAQQLLRLREQGQLSDEQINSLPGEQLIRDRLRRTQQLLNQDDASGTLNVDWRASQPKPVPPAADQADLRTAGQALLAVVTEFRAAIADLRKPASPTPDFTGRARREQAAAVG